MDDNDRASDSEEQDRALAQRRQAEQSQSIKPAEECRHCDEPLEPHRRPYGTCIDCQTMVEARNRHYRKD